MKEETNYISKKLFVDSDFIKTSFEGNEVLNYSISPKGVAKVKIIIQTGMVSIERTQDDFTGVITLNFETTDGVDNYNHEYKITFKNAGNEVLDEDDVELSEEDEEDEIIEDDSENVEYLSEDDEEATSGGGGNGERVNISLSNLATYEYRFIADERSTPTITITRGIAGVRWSLKKYRICTMTPPKRTWGFIINNKSKFGKCAAKARIRYKLDGSYHYIDVTAKI